MNKIENMFNLEKLKAEYAAHLDRVLAGKERLMTTEAFLGQRLAEAMVAKVMAEQGWLAA